MKTKEIYLCNKPFIITDEGKIINPKTGNYVGSKATNGKGSARYCRVSVNDNGKTKMFYLHRIIAEHFVTGYFEGATVDHINSDRNDNRASNLQWVSQSENSRKFMNESWTNGKMKHKSKERKGKKVTITYPTGEVRVFNSIEKASKYVGIDLRQAKLYHKSNTFTTRWKHKIEIAE